MNLYGQQMTRRDLEARAARLEQLGGVRRLQWTEGLEAGSEQIQLRSGAGLACYISPDRALDISLAEFAGVPLSWQGPNGDVHPAFAEGQPLSFLRSCAGGLLMTCGLTQVGSPCADAGESLTLHGRAHHLPARQVVAEGRWEGEDYVMRVAGLVEETALLCEHLRLTRELRVRLGHNRLEIHDTVENLAFTPVPHMMLYHFNFGYPLLSEESRIKIPSHRVLAREAGASTEGFDRFDAPLPGCTERVLYHEELETRADPVSGEAMTSVELHQPHFPLAGGTASTPLTLRLSWSTATLPRMVQWLMPAAGTYVLGLEPANCHVEGRAAERQRGTLVTLAPGERRQYRLALEVLTA